LFNLVVGALFGAAGFAAANGEFGAFFLAAFFGLLAINR
jgi:hypothetical protein